MKKETVFTETGHAKGGLRWRVQYTTGYDTNVTIQAGTSYIEVPFVGLQEFATMLMCFCTEVGL